MHTHTTWLHINSEKSLPLGTIITKFILVLLQGDKLPLDFLYSCPPALSLNLISALKRNTLDFHDFHILYITSNWLYWFPAVMIWLRHSDQSVFWCLDYLQDIAPSFPCFAQTLVLSLHFSWMNCSCFHPGIASKLWLQKVWMQFLVCNNHSLSRLDFTASYEREDNDIWIGLVKCQALLKHHLLCHWGTDLANWSQ